MYASKTKVICRLLPTILFEDDIQISSRFFGFDLVFDVYDVKIHHHTIY